ncbi:ribosome-associated translation inhibitor RaiA [Olleya sp. YS]|uniref:ribosome hibernation-promoting factor, HPF/YfiA family n=1 Tax=Olleya sp. YS TaxID=3028318 RepID=UPI0024345AA7|nr:ribosome-associated translation inhibitor RaiA [Olleya sp. YS]WGD34511.1 ribosome-associated translation inhibitor RaiA [Olleya sp. YS]
MDINFEYDNVKASADLEQYTSEKVQKLANKYEFIVRADVFFKVEQTGNNTGKIAGIRLSAPGPRLFAEDNNESLHKSVSEVVNQLERQLSKRKGKMKTH